MMMMIVCRFVINGSKVAVSESVFASVSLHPSLLSFQCNGGRIDSNEFIKMIESNKLNELVVRK